MHHVPRPVTAIMPGWTGSQRLVGIDALRGFAALAVCLFHWEHIAFGTANDAQVFRYGLLGVELFFMISGFVILAVAERARSVRSFVLARVVRLYPAYLASVALTAVYVLWLRKYDVPTIIINLTMVQSFFDVPNITNPYWTLAFEISFYAILTTLLATCGVRCIETASLLWLGVAMVFRFAVAGPLGFDQDRPLEQLGYIIAAPQFAPFFIMGLMIHRLRAGDLRVTGCVSLAIAIGITMLGREDFAHVKGFPYAMFTCSAGLMLYLASRQWQRTSLLSPLAKLGSVSYPLYLIHCTLANISVAAFAGTVVSTPLAVAISIPASLALAFALHAGVERPVTKGYRRVVAGHRSRRQRVLEAAEVQLR